MNTSLASSHGEMAKSVHVLIENKRTGSEAIRILPEVAFRRVRYPYVNCGFVAFGYLFFRSFIAENTGRG